MRFGKMSSKEGSKQQQQQSAETKNATKKKKINIITSILFENKPSVCVFETNEELPKNFETTSIGLNKPSTNCGDIQQF